MSIANSREMGSDMETPEEIDEEKKGARLGMWLFLFTEILLFGGLFLLYAAYRWRFPDDFHYGAGELNVALGTLNTIILLTSSLTMVLAVTSIRNRNRKLASIFLLATILLGCEFLLNKYVEWSEKIHHGLYPNSDVLQMHSPGENLFYSLYFGMTGLHGLHIIIGVGILSVMLFHVFRKLEHPLPSEIYKKREIQVENAGLFWHLVDVIWIFLFPLFYLIT
ncbi:MAG: cytochrome c oxidase subunit 3 family protein [Candidatus Omnitrophota bacterium]